MPRLTRWEQYIIRDSTRFHHNSLTNHYNRRHHLTVYRHNKDTRANFTRPYSQSTTTKMPLVVPGINSEGSGDQTQSWMQKLMGKKISESGKTDESNFARNELPQKHRLLTEDSAMTMDFNPDRYVNP